MESGLQGGFSNDVLIISYSMVANFGEVVAPTIDEFYSRSYLLPRMGYAGKWTSLFHNFVRYIPLIHTLDDHNPNNRGAAFDLRSTAPKFVY